MFNLRGTGVALVTPFTEEQAVDYSALSSLLEHTAVVDYYVVMGTTGESATCTKEEKAAILSFVKKGNKQSKPIVYGIGGNNTIAVIERIKNEDLEGVDAILSVCPYYNKPSQEGIYRHFKAIADASPLPIILYNVPGRTGISMSAETTLRLAVHPNIIGTKEASGDIEQTLAIVRNKPDDFVVTSGDDLLSPTLISAGAEGVISVLANAYPVEMKEMIDRTLAGDFASSRKEVFKFMDLNPLLYAESNPVGIKQTLANLGIMKNMVRLPLAPASEWLQKSIKEAMVHI